MRIRSCFPGCLRIGNGIASSWDKVTLKFGDLPGTQYPRRRLIRPYPNCDAEGRSENCFRRYVRNAEARTALLRLSVARRFRGAISFSLVPGPLVCVVSPKAFLSGQSSHAYT